MNDESVPVLSTEEERVFRQGVAHLGGYDEPMPRTAMEANTREWAERVRRLLATLTAERAAYAERIAALEGALLDARVFLRYEGFDEYADGLLAAALSEKGAKE